jgi:hypothetical protein
MTDLTNKIGNTPVADMQVLYTKYASIGEFVAKYKEHIPYLIWVINAGVEYIRDMHTNLNIDWKAFTIVLLKHQYLNGSIKTEEDIYLHIDEFVKHYNDDYKNYIDNLGISSTEFDRDYGFVCNYLHKKKR